MGEKWASRHWRDDIRQGRAAIDAHVSLQKR